MSISSRLVYVKSEDLLDDDAPLQHASRLSLSTRRQLAGFALAAAGLPLLTLALNGTSSSLSLEGEVLLYLLAVVIIALVGGILVAVASAVAAALLINYYFVEPLHTLDVAHADQAVALVVFVVVAVVVSGAVEVAARRARAAEKASAQAETLSTLAGADLDEHETLRGVLDQARRTFAMQSVVLMVRDHVSGDWSDVEQSGWAPAGKEAPMRFDVPINPDLRLVGRGPAMFAEDQRVLQAFAGAAQTAFEGRRLTEEASRAQSLATVDRQRTALLAAVGHDLRTPLAAIKASASTLRQTDVTWSDDERDQLLETIEDAADRLDSVVANLLDASRLQAGAVSVQALPVSLDEMVSVAVLAVAGASERVTADVPEDLPLVSADPGLLERVLVNLLDNALRYGHDGGTVEVHAVAGDKSAKLEIVDHGPGVAVEQRDRLFEPFQQLGDSGGGGVGLGLWVARGFVEAMDGAMVADQTSGGGLTMRIRLPLAVREPA
jgi:two-component system, OmpR family, sensor histidine kinase KdpD